MGGPPPVTPGQTTTSASSPSFSNGGEPLAGEDHPHAAPSGLLSLPELAGISAEELRAKYDIPVEVNEAVVAYIRFFQTDDRDHFATLLSRSGRWIPLMRPILEKDRLPFDLVYFSMIASGFNPFAYSDAKAAGLWQFDVGTSRRYGLTTDFWTDERRDPIRSTEAAGRYLRDLIDHFNGNWYLAWAGYSAGEETINEAMRVESTVDFWRMMSNGHTLPVETKHLVPKLIAAALIAKYPERFGFHVDYEPLFTFDEVHIDHAISLQALARAARTDVETMRQLNPALRRACTPPTGWELRIPVGSKEQFIAAYEKLAASEHLSFVEHKIERGESLPRIATAYGTTEVAILRTNGLTSYRQLRVGRVLQIPLADTRGLLTGEQVDDPAPQNEQERIASDPPAERTKPTKAPPLGASAASRQLIGKLAVLNLANLTTGLSNQDVRFFTDRVRQETLRKEPGTEVMTRENLLVLLQATGKTLEECEGECEIDTGRRIGADLVVSGEIQKVGSYFKISLRLHETKEGRLLAAAIASVKSIDELDKSVAAAVDELYATAIEPVPPLAPASRPR